MGQDSTINLLTQMNGTLKGILAAMTPKNQMAQDRNMTDRIHKGDTIAPPQAAPTEQAASVGSFGKLTIDDIIKSISGLPGAVKDIARLKSKDLEQFTNVLESIGEAIKKLAEDTDGVVEFKAIDAFAKGIKTLEDAHMKSVMREFVAIDKMKGIEHMLRVTKGLAQVSKEARKINVGDLKKITAASKGMNAMHTLAKSMLTVVGSVIAVAVAMKLLGDDGGSQILKSVGVVMLIMTGLTALAVAVGVAGKLIKPVSMTPMLGFIAGVQVLVLSTLLLGMVAQQAWPDILIGFGAVGATMLGYVLIISLCNLIALKAKVSAPDFGAVLGLAAISTGLVLATLLMGYVAIEANEQILAGFAAVAGIIFGYSTVIGVSAKISKLSTVTINDMMRVMAIGIMASVLVYASMKVGELAQNNLGDIVVGFGAISVILGAYTMLVSFLSNRFKIAEMAKATNTLKTIGMIGLEAMLLVGGAVLLSKYVEMTNPGALAMTLAMTAGIMLGIVGLAKTASKISKDIKPGIKALMLIELLAAGALAMVHGIVKVTEKVSEVGADKMLITIGGMVGVVAAFGGLAYAAGKIPKSTILVGSGVLALLEILAFGSARVIQEVAKTTTMVQSLGSEPWKEMLKTMGGMAAVIGEFAALAALCGIPPVPAVLAMGAAAMGAVELVALGATKVVIKTMEAAELIGDDVNTKIDAVTGAFKHVVESLGSMLGLKFAAKMAIVTANAPLMGLVSSTMLNLTNTLSGIALVAGTDGMLRPAKFLDDGRIAYGEFADVKAATMTITDSLTYFVDNLFNTFKEIKIGDMIKTAVGMEVLSLVMDPVSKFADVMLSFQEGGTEGTIHSITFDEDGNVKYGPDVDIAKVAQTIANAVTIFSKTMFSDENMEIWSNLISGSSFVMTHSGFLGLKTNVEQLPGTAQQAMGILAMIIEPVCSFAQTMAMFSGAENGILSIPVYDSEGKLTSTRSIDVAAAATAIANAVTSFAKIIAENASVWNDLLYAAGTTTVKTKDGWFSDEYETTNNMEQAMGIFGGIMTPIIAFTNMITKFGTEGGSLVTFDSKGVARKIDIQFIATSIGSTVTDFVKTIAASFAENDENLSKISSSVSNIQKILSDLPNMFVKISTDVDTTKLTQIATSCSTFLVSVTSMAMAPFGEVNASITQFGSTISSVNPQIVDHEKSFTESTKQASDTLVKLKTSIENVDNALDKGMSKRIGNLDKISERYRQMAKNAGELGENLALVKQIMDQLKGYNANDFKDVAGVITGIQVTGMLTKDEVMEAIKSTIGNMEFSKRGNTNIYDCDIS